MQSFKLHLTLYSAAALRVFFSKHFDVSVILEKYFAYAVFALTYPKTTIRGFKSQPVPGPFPLPVKGPGNEVGTQGVVL